MDHFKDDREVLAHAIDQTGELGAVIGDWVADNVLGDPLLTDAMTLANGAEGAVRAAHLLLRQAWRAMPPETEEGESGGEN